MSTDKLSKNVPKSHVFEVRGDVRTFAALARYLLRQGIHIRTKSELGCECMELLLSILTANGMEQKFESSDLAREYLKSVGLDGTKGNRGIEALAKQIQLEQSTGVAGSFIGAEDSTEDLVRKAMEAFDNG